MKVWYLTALLLALLGLIVIDFRFHLAWWRDARRALLTFALGLTYFLTWDAVGIHSNIFFIGPAKILTGWRIAPQVPIEELFFLTLLIYVTLIIWQLMQRFQAKKSAEQQREI